MEDWSRNIYGNVMGALPVTNRVSSIGNGKDLSKTKESMSETSLDKANKVRAKTTERGPRRHPCRTSFAKRIYSAAKVNKTGTAKKLKSQISGSEEINEKD